MNGREFSLLMMVFVATSIGYFCSVAKREPERAFVDLFDRVVRLSAVVAIAYISLSLLVQILAPD